MACVTACPSGVQYAPLIEATRGQIERRYPRSLGDRLFRERDLRAASRIRRGFASCSRRCCVVQAVAPKAAAAASPAPPEASHNVLPARRASSRDARARAARDLAVARSPRVPARTPAAGDRRLTVGLSPDACSASCFRTSTRATVNVLAAEGCDVVAPAEQGCCGALALHAGRLDDARAFARRTIEVFERAGVERIVVNAAGCGSSMKEYGQLLADDPAWAERARAFAARVRDVSEIARRARPAAGAAPPARAARGVSRRLSPRARAGRPRSRRAICCASIPGIELLPLADPDICCGSAGIYNLVEPDTARELGDRKAAHIAAVQPDVIATANPGCMLQIAAARQAAAAARGRSGIRSRSLDASIRGSNPIFACP